MLGLNEQTKKLQAAWKALVKSINYGKIEDSLGVKRSGECGLSDVRSRCFHIEKSLLKDCTGSLDAGTEIEVVS